MNRVLIATLIKKELRQVLRNRRIIIGLLLPLILYPVLFNVYGSVMTNAEQKSAAETSTVVIMSEMPKTLEDLLSDDERLNLTEDLTMSQEQLLGTESDLGISYSQESGQHHLKFYFDSGQSDARKAYDRVLESVEQYEKHVKVDYLKAHHVSPLLLNPIEIETQDVANQTEQSGKSLGDIIPMILTISALLSIVSFAVEMTTGEKENGTLETLFSMPFKRSELVFSKLIACVSLGLVSMLINLVALVMLLPSLIKSSNLAFTLDVTNVTILILTLIPLILMGAGASLGVGMFANSYKESGAYVTPLTFLFMIPAYVGMIPGIELNQVLATIPIVNSTLLIKSVFIGTFSLKYFMVCFISNILFSLLALLFVFRIFGAEKILFGSGKSFTLRLNRKDIKRKALIEPQDAILLVVIAIVFYIYAGSVASKELGIIGGTLFIQYVAFAAIPLFLTWYMKADIKESLHFRKPKLMPSLAGVFMWLGTLSFMLLYQFLISDYITEAPTMAGIDDLMNSMGLFSQFFFIAITPAICEELLFRGFAFRPLEKSLGPKKAIVITALLFAIMHLDIVRLLPTFLLGLVFATIAYVSGSIWPVMLLHMANNAIAAFALNDWMPSISLLLTVGVLGIGSGVYILLKNPLTRSKNSFTIDVSNE